MKPDLHSRRFVLWKNWGHNFRCRPEWLHAPDSLEGMTEVIRLARESGRSIRPVGSGYSYSRLVQTDQVMLSLERFTGVESIERQRGIAVVRAGTGLRALVRELAAQGYALENLGDIDKQTLAGAIATGTHGTGIGIGNISTQVEAI